jgi:predicted NodU family carbamoyl transferase
LILFDRFYNTKFNEYVGEPIVNTPEQSYQMLVKTDMDYLVMGNFLIKRDL